MARSSGIIYLPIAAMVCALFMPAMNGSVSETTKTLFIPVAWPTHRVGLQIRNRLLPAQTNDPLSPGSARTFEQIKRENAALWNEISNLREQLKDLEQLSAQYRNLGADLRKIVQSAAVVGTSPDHRKSLMISTAGIDGVRVSAAVVHPMGFVGKIDAVGVAGGNARVMLLTDPSLRVVGKFVRLVSRGEGSVAVEDLQLDPPLIEGTGTGLIARQMKTAPLKEKLKIGDSVILDDQQQFPHPALKGLRIGMVSKIKFPSSDARLTEVEITPVTDYSLLPEVMVVTR